jgi:hypothetical protein
MNLTRVTLATASSVLLLATLAACGGGDDTATDSPDTAAQAGGAPNGGQGAGGGRFPGASGTVAAVSGSTAQVQNDQSGQVAVSWTKDTTFTQQVDATLADVTVGSCVMVTTADDGDTAATVRITAANDDDSCGFGGGQGGGQGGGPGGGQNGGERPEGAPTGMPSDMPSGAPGGGRGFGTIGEVAAVSAGGFTVSATRPGNEEATDVSVTVGDDTTYTTQAKAQASAVTVGRCVTARGDSDNTGAVTATTISVSDPVDGQCGAGFGGGFGGGMRGPEGGAA